MARYESILDLIGNTPMVDISALSPNPRVAILTKLEGWNPGGSVKDRAAKAMVEEAEKDGLPRPGQQILESSSGQHRHRAGDDRQGQGLPDQDRPARERVDRASPAARSPGARRSSTRPGRRAPTAPCAGLRRSPREHPEWWFPVPVRQSVQSAEPTTRAPVPRSGGTAPRSPTSSPGWAPPGTLMGVGRFLKERNPAIQVWAVQPPAGEMVDGLKNLDEGFIPPIFTDNDGFDLLDRSKIIGPRESVEWTRRLADVGIFAGISSGAIMAAAVKCAAEIDEGVIVTIVCDGGWKYLSTGVWTDDLDAVTERAKREIYF